MSTSSTDTGFSARQLWAASWLLGLVSVGAFFKLALYAQADPWHLRPKLFVWLAVATVAAVFCACCAVVVAIKEVEARRVQRDLQNP